MDFRLFLYTWYIVSPTNLRIFSKKWETLMMASRLTSELQDSRRFRYKETKEMLASCRWGWQDLGQLFDKPVQVFMPSKKVSLDTRLLFSGWKGKVLICSLTSDDKVNTTPNVVWDYLCCARIEDIWPKRLKSPLRQLMNSDTGQYK